MCSLGRDFGFSDLHGGDAVDSRGSSGLVVSVSCPVSISHSLFSPLCFAVHFHALFANSFTNLRSSGRRRRRRRSLYPKGIC